MGLIYKSVAWLLAPISEEARGVNMLRVDAVKGAEMLRKLMLERNVNFVYILGVYYSPLRMISVEMDIYGPEVSICGGPLLDCNPWYYDLDKEQGRELYDAILTNVPGTVGNIIKRQQRKAHDSVDSQTVQ